MYQKSKFEVLRKKSLKYVDDVFFNNLFHFAPPSSSHLWCGPASCFLEISMRAVSS